MGKAFLLFLTLFKFNRLNKLPTQTIRNKFVMLQSSNYDGRMRIKFFGKLNYKIFRNSESLQYFILFFFRKSPPDSKVVCLFFFILIFIRILNVF